MQTYWTFMLGVIEDQGSTAEQKDGAIDALSELFDERVDDRDIPNGLCEKIIQVCEHEIVRRSEIGESPRVSICYLVLNALFYSDRRGQLDMVSHIVNHEKMIMFVFDGIENETGDHEVFGRLFMNMLENSSVSDDITLIIRYFYKLRNAFISIFSRDLVEDDDIMERIFYSTEMIGVVSTMPSELYKWAHKGQTSDRKECLFILLERAINWPKTMEKLLECGFLSVSQHYAHLPINQTTVREANVFRGILLMHPEYRQVFRRLTCDGVTGNATADFGRSIPPRRTGVGRNYVLVDEETEMF